MSLEVPPPSDDPSIVRIGSPGHLFSTDVQKVIVAPEPTTSPKFGILDLHPQTIRSPPQFTEEATIAAMRNLNVAPEDLIPQDPDIEDIPLRVSTKLELERRRYETIQEILAERNRILSLPALDVSLSAKSTVRRRGERKVVKKSVRREPELPSILAVQIRVPPPGPPVRREFRRRRPAAVPAPIDGDEERRIRLAEIQRGAQCRLAKAKVEESVLARRRRRLREEANARMREQARRYMLLQEKKQKALVAEREWRRANLYGGAKEQKGRSNALSELRQKFLNALTQPQPERETLRPPIPIAEVVNGPEEVQKVKAQSYDRQHVPVALPIVTSASVDQGRIGPLRSKLPIIGRGKTKIPQLRK
jgi:hypothetical protein